MGEDRKEYGRNDISIYTDRDCFAAHHQAWEHVRAYGGKIG